MRYRIRIAALAGMAVIALSAAACATGQPSEDPTGNAGLTEVSVHGCTPQNPLIGSWTNEVCGGHVLLATESKLVRYDSKTMEPMPDVAESIETDDAQLFTVTLKKGYKFSDGTEVKAKNFVDAWNYASYAPNGAPQSAFFDPIAGWADLQCSGEGGACDEAVAATMPAKETLDGLKIVDDYTFTIETTEPTSNLPVRLGYAAFSPLPDAFFAADADF
ncbi:MAG: ABC transporter substrate-binding protein, partial [Propionibacteriaceae bacterium]|nr:ABC transporter substrate-binding protein [Propionibacteriaceae bacterium]